MTVNAIIQTTPLTVTANGNTKLLSVTKVIPAVQLSVSQSQTDSFARQEIANHLADPNPHLISYTTAENITSHKPIAIVNGLAYIFNPYDTTHAFAFAGFSVTGASLGQMINVKTDGKLTLNSWGLTQGTHYLAGANGTLITDNSGLAFSKVVAYAQTTETIQILDYSPINL